MGMGVEQGNRHGGCGAYASGIIISKQRVRGHTRSSMLESGQSDEGAC